MANSCDTVQSLRTGDGVTTQFSFTFTYDKESEVNVSLWDTTIKYYVPLANDQWSLVNATTIQFNTAPPAIVDDSGNAIANVKIWRQTDIESLVASFYPGSAIRAQDLNNNFEQLQHAIQEGRCSIPDGVVVLLEDYWNRTTDTLKSTDDWVSSDEKVATAAAISGVINTTINAKDYVVDAPSDNTEYVRLNGSWSPLPPDQSGVPEAPIDSKTYGRNNAAWVEVTGGGSGGGLIYKGTRDLTLPAPSSSSDGDLYVNTATSGVADNSWTGIGGEALVGAERVAYGGSVWQILPMSSSGVEEVLAGNDISVNSSNVKSPVVSVTPNSFIPFNISTLGALP